MASLLSEPIVPRRHRRSFRARCLAPVREMLPELDAVAFRVDEADELALPLGVWPAGHGRGLYAVLMQAFNRDVDILR